MTAKPSKLVDKIGAFVAVPLSMVRCGHISIEAKAIFSLLRSYPSSNETGTAFPSYETIQECTGIKSFSTIAKRLRELETLGWIERQKRYGATTIYTLKMGESPASPTLNVALPVLHAVESSPTRRVGQSYTTCRGIRESVSENETNQNDSRRGRAKQPDPRTNHPAILTYCEISRKRPSIAIYDKVISALGDAPNIDTLRSCFEAWVQRGYNPQAATWAIEWYPAGGPPARTVYAGKQSAVDQNAISQAYRDRYAFASDLAFGKKMEADTNGN